MERWFHVESPEISAIVQQLAFAAGFGWAQELCPEHVQYAEQEVLFFEANGQICYGDLEYAQEHHSERQLKTIEELVEFFAKRSTDNE